MVWIRRRVGQCMRLGGHRGKCLFPVSELLLPADAGLLCSNQVLSAWMTALASRSFSVSNPTEAGAASDSHIPDGDRDANHTWRPFWPSCPGNHSWKLCQELAAMVLPACDKGHIPSFKPFSCNLALAIITLTKDVEDLYQQNHKTQPIVIHLIVVTREVITLKPLHINHSQ